MSSSSTPGSTCSTHPAAGSVVGDKYRIEQILGQGGMGIVVRATHLQLGEAVALKFLHGEIAQDPEHVERFLREARAAAQIKSEHVARVFDVGTLPSGEPFIVMELLVGDDLNRLVRERGPLPIAEAIEYVGQACRAIAEAHQHGIVHRDLKPANLFVARRADGSPLVKVLDFGISKRVDGSDQTLTQTGDIVGSPQYMSPEQIRDARCVDGRSDIWALGSILYKLLTGRAPFAADTSAGTLARIVADPVPPLRAVRPEVPPELEAIVVRCLEKSPERRLQRVEDLASALSSVLHPVPVPVTVPTGPALAAAAPPAAGGLAMQHHLTSTVRVPVLAGADSTGPSGETTATASALTAARPAPPISRLALPFGALLAIALASALAIVVTRPAPGIVASGATTGSPDLHGPGPEPTASGAAVPPAASSGAPPHVAASAAPPPVHDGGDPHTPATGVVASASSRPPPRVSAPAPSVAGRPGKPAGRGQTNAYDDRL